MYIYKHFQDLKSKKKKKNHINNQISLPNIQNTKNISQNFINQRKKNKEKLLEPKTQQNLDKKKKNPQQSQNF